MAPVRLRAVQAGGLFWEGRWLPGSAPIKHVQQVLAEPGCPGPEEGAFLYGHRRCCGVMSRSTAGPVGVKF
jgi:hypothetical protein